MSAFDSELDRLRLREGPQDVDGFAASGEQHFYGDFYRYSSHDVTRGLSLPTSDFGQQAKFDYVPGDCYASQCAETTRGLTLGSDEAYAFERDPWTDSKQSVDYSNKGYGFGGNDIPGNDNPVMDYVPNANPSPDDPIVVNPPSTPDDPHFRLQVTTLYASKSSLPKELWEAVEDFLRRVESSVTKVNRRKCAINADVFEDGVMCSLKIRIYVMGDGRYAIEFQRKGGDSLTFNAAYKKATSFINSQVGDLPEPEIASHATQLPQSSLPRREADSIQVLLDMAATELPRNQAEVATMLAKIAQEDRDRAAVLCSEPAFSALNILLNSDSTEVQYPSAVAFAHLSAMEQAAPFFQVGDICTLLTRVTANDTCDLVKEKLAQAIRQAVHQHRSQLQQNVKDTLRKELGAAVKERMSETAAALLEEARWGL